MDPTPSDSTSTVARTEVPVSRAPFRDPAADIILRSSDEIDFHVHRVVLGLSSPVFAHMFASPQPDTEPAVPIVRMAESGAVLDRILRFWYPGAEPVVQNLGQLREILEILLQKYDMQAIVPLGQQYLRGYIEAEPMGCFAVAASHNWDALALIAAKECLKRQLRNFSYTAPQELGCVTGTTLYALLQYHFQCGEAVRAAGTNLRWISGRKDLVWLGTGYNGCTCKTSTAMLSTETRYVPEWFLQLLQSLVETFPIAPMGNRDDRALICRALKEAAKCSFCKTHAYETLPRWMASQWWPKTDAGIVELKLRS
ncbi:hypothetical protein DFH06DRAFT_688867 [Mycena polygramma]|nr:hypothetical protein DFH06DRAFT_688867 [Mycena polygramma]